MGLFFHYVVFIKETSIRSDDVCVLSASGTAAVVSLHYADLGDNVSNLPTSNKTVKEMASSLEEKDKTDVIIVRIITF